MLKIKKCGNSYLIQRRGRLLAKTQLQSGGCTLTRGDDINPNVRARLVPREMRNAGDDAIFAPTPPLESLRTVLSLATTQLPGQKVRCRDPDSDERVQVSLADNRWAYFNTKVDPSSPAFC